MDRVFANFQIDNDFYIMLFLFLLITMIISTVIVVFLSKIQTLSVILEQAKEIDRAKEERLSFLNTVWNDEKINNIKLKEELKYLENSKEKLGQAEKILSTLQEQIIEQEKEHVDEVHASRTRYDELKIHYKILIEQLEKSEEELFVIKRSHEELKEKSTLLYTQKRELEIKFSEQQKQTVEKIEMMESHRGELKEEFAELASKIFEGNSKAFTKFSHESLSSLMKPMESQISEFKQQINTLYSDEAKDRTLLKQEILSLKELNQQISQDAINLTNTLKAEKEQQGIWGEKILEKVLESSGLRKGIEYSCEVSLISKEGKVYQPDVLVYLPDNRDLIIDAKTSLIAYEKFINASLDKPKEMYLKEHTKALRKHIKSLSEKNHENLVGVNSLDFIFMFVPIEGALAVALESDIRLYDDAFKRQIVLVGPTTLLIAMRAIENVWKYEKQNKNAKEIASRAGALYDKFVNFSKDMIKISKQFDSLHGNFESAKQRLSEGQGNIVRQVEQLREMGARTSKIIPRELT
jgi:DNA recombination protein RmuC